MSCGNLILHKKYEADRRFLVSGIIEVHHADMTLFEAVQAIAMRIKHAVSMHHRSLSHVNA